MDKKDTKLESLLISNIIHHFNIIDDVKNFLEVEDFVIRNNQEIYKALLNTTYPKRDTKIEYEYLKGNMNNNIVTLEVYNSYDFDKIDDIEFLIEEVKRLSENRNLAGDLERLKSQVLDDKDILEVYKNLERVVYPKIEKQLNADSYKSIYDCMFETINEVENNARIDSYVTGLDTGFSNLNLMTNGFQKSDLILIAARPSMGKTAFALNLLNNISEKEKTVLFISLEMSSNQLMHRLISINSGISINKIRRGKLDEKEWDTFIAKSNDLIYKPIYINDYIDSDIEKIVLHSKKAKKEINMDAIIIDYLQLMNVKGKENRNNEIAYITRRLKLLAKELNIPIIVLSQLSRACETRMYKRPLLSDLRESGAIEQDADIVMFLYRDYYYNKGTKDRYKTEVIIAKHRNGRVGSLDLRFIEDTTAMVSL